MRESNNQIKVIQVSFENLELFEFKGETVSFLGVNGISDSFVYGDGKLTKYTVCESLTLQLTQDANKIESNITNMSDEFKSIPFKRILEQGDIVSIDISFSDGTRKNLFTNWHDGSKDTNSYQSSLISQRGELCIVIDGGTTAEETFVGGL